MCVQVHLCFLGNGILLLVMEHIIAVCVCGDLVSVVGLGNVVL